MTEQLMRQERLVAVAMTPAERARWMARLQSGCRDSGRPADTELASLAGTTYDGITLRLRLLNTLPPAVQLVIEDESGACRFGPQLCGPLFWAYALARNGTTYTLELDVKLTMLNQAAANQYLLVERLEQLLGLSALLAGYGLARQVGLYLQAAGVLAARARGLAAGQPELSLPLTSQPTVEAGFARLETLGGCRVEVGHLLVQAPVAAELPPPEPEYAALLEDALAFLPLANPERLASYAAFAYALAAHAGPWPPEFEVVAPAARCFYLGDTWAFDQESAASRQVAANICQKFGLPPLGG